jgi:glucose/arabinose dehydrogenase
MMPGEIPTVVDIGAGPRIASPECVRNRGTTATTHDTGCVTVATVRRRTIWPAAALVAAALITVEGHPPPAEAATVSSGFTDAAIANFTRPTAVEWLPGDRIAVLEQGGRLRLGRPGQPFTTALTIANICSNGERGLLGLAPDPGFLGNGWVYLYYTRVDGGAPGGCVNRVSRFQMRGDTIDPASEVVLLDRISSLGGNHNGGDIDVGADGNLYVAVGDAGADPRGNSGSAGSNDAAQDLSLLNGKILRITRLGHPAPGNPFNGAGTARCATRGNTPSTPTTTCREIYSWGLRNPYRIAFDRNDGSDRFFINDVGQKTYEEVNRGAAGNFGWPTREGPCPQGSTTPCPGPTAGLIDPITAYGRAEGSYVTAGAFTPDGLWPTAYDGSYLFADGGSGRIWVRRANGSVDYGAPFATDAFGITDMTFGFDTAGRMVLYYVQIGGTLRVITPTAAPASVTATDLRMIPITPERAYDTGPGVGVAKGTMVNGTTRLVDLAPPAAYPAALVNITVAFTAGSGFVRTWLPRGARPVTSSLNADGANATVGNGVIVPLAPDGTFILEASTSARVVVDVMAWFAPTSGTSDAGRLASLSPARLVDTRLPSGQTIESGSTNPWRRVGTRIDLDAAGQVGVPDDGTAAAVVLSLAALGRPGQGGWVAAAPGGAPYPGTASVNVVPGDVRNNIVVVPLGATTDVSIFTKNVNDVVVDVLGYVTSATAPVAGAGLFTPVAATRVADTRIPKGFGRLSPLIPSTLSVPGGASSSAVAQTITVTRTGGAGWIVAHPSTDPPLVSNLNFQAAGQTRGALAFSQLTASGRERFTSKVATDVVVDVVGFFSE